MNVLTLSVFGLTIFCSAVKQRTNDNVTANGVSVNGWNVNGLSEITDEALRHVVETVWRRKVTVKCDFARKHAAYIGMAASMQMITTRVDQGVYANEWHVTAKGLRWLRETE